MNILGTRDAVFICQSLIKIKSKKITVQYAIRCEKRGPMLTVFKTFFSHRVPKTPKLELPASEHVSGNDTAQPT